MNLIWYLTSMLLFFMLFNFEPEFLDIERNYEVEIVAENKSHKFSYRGQPGRPGSGRRAHVR
jgi:hypothetical protein